MGDTGPCGPCTEIHVDCRSDEEREQVEGSTLVNQDHPQVIEIWNNVFIQFNRIKDGSLQPLPARHVDTGMGFERLVRVLQGKQSNYDTDLFEPTLRKIEELSGAAYEGTMVKKDIAFRVIADHIRAISFTIADGQLPSNAGAGYVIRRILRRAIRYYFSFLDCQEPLLASLVPVIAEQFKDVFPELHQQIDFVQRVIREEELSFLKTLDSGIRRFEQIVAESAGTLPGEKVFELMDTFGFPVDLSVLMAQEKGRVIDMAGFEAALQLQKERSRASAQIENEDWVVVNEVPEMSFVGYDNLNVETSIVKYRSFKAKDAIGHQVVLKETPFYAESGGQVGDTGFLMFGHERVNVLNTKKENDLIIHTVDHLPQNAAQEVVAQVDEFRRNKITVNHSATHLMHAALRQILGPHVVQKGSLVNDVHLRFDFSHFAKVTDEEIAQIEDIVNEKIRENIPVIIKYMDKDEALRTGAMALFGEKYGNIVRVVIIDPAYSIELCGGCHVGYTGEIGLFKITSESAVAAGVRRVEAMTGQAALQYLNAYVEEVRQVRQLMGNPKEVITKLNDLIAENKSLRKEMEKMEADKALRLQHELSESVRSNSAGVNYIISRTELSDNKLLKNIGFNLARESGDALVALINCYDEKVTIQINISESLADKKIYNAGELVRQLAPLIGGGGGGQVGYATAGGNNVSGIDSVLEQLTQLVE
ncbi:MAG TPA: alanine--tRNA ligase, partial [Saprospiraceae bacterium]|nr:alanine--tRNA ligase [Saprospiraceae bacterium]